MEFLDLDARSIEHICLFLDKKSIFNLATTCQKFYTSLPKSTFIWQAKLKQDFDLHITLTPNQEIQDELYKLTRALYTHSGKANGFRSLIPFKGVFTNGGIDSSIPLYWIQNLFQAAEKDGISLEPPSEKALGNPYCSNCSANADVIAILLPGWSDFPDDRVYNYRKWMEYKLRTLQIGEPLSQRTFLGLRNLFLTITDMFRLEGGFDGPAGRHLLQGITSAEDRERERHKILDMAADLRAGRDKITTQVVHPKNKNIIIDGSAVNHLRTLFKEKEKKAELQEEEEMEEMEQQVPEAAEEIDRSFALIRSIDIGRKGLLTCPVQAGVVFTGFLDYNQLASIVGPQQQQHSTEAAMRMMNSLQASTQSSSCELTSFENLKNEDDVIELVKQGVLPPIIDLIMGPSGLIIEFGSKRDDDDALCTGNNNHDDDDALERLERYLRWFRAFEPDTDLMADANDDFDEEEEEEEVEEEGEEGDDFYTDDDAEGEEEAMEMAVDNEEVRERGMTPTSPLLSGESSNAKKNDGSTKAQDDNDNDKNKLVAEWKPSLWFRFHTRPEAIKFIKFMKHRHEQQMMSSNVDMAGVLHARRSLDYLLQEMEMSQGVHLWALNDQLKNYVFKRPRVGNAVMVRFINQENLMDEMQDDHDWPNIDASHVHVYGQGFRVGSWASVLGGGGS